MKDLIMNPNPIEEMMITIGRTIAFLGFLNSGEIPRDNPPMNKMRINE
jgi:hypothetical protein